MTTPPNSPTPDYGTLGPGSDIKTGAETLTPWGSSQPVFGRPQPGTGSSQPANPAPRMAVVFAAVLMSMGMGLGAWMFARRPTMAGAVPQTQSQTDSVAQREAERLLQRAAGNDANATTEIQEHASAWRGRLQLTPQLTNLIAAGMNARDLRTRAATIQLDLAAMNVAEDDASVDRLAVQAESNDHATRIWALWTLGLLANRGVERQRITELLMAHLSDSDADARRWAVEALACIGSDETIPALLKTMRDDPSPTVRERAACSLAESGMLTPEQRRSAIPTLLTYADNPSLDAATRAWTFHALRDITGQSLPDDASKWREWYERRR